MSTSKAAPRKAAPKAGPKKTAPKAPEPKRERFLILLRHGLAEDPSAEKKDEDRGLTAEGHTRLKEIARGLERILPSVTAIHSSPLLRAVQTALWVSKGYRSLAPIVTSDALAPGASPAAFLTLVDSLQAERAVIVGHEPTLTNGMRALVKLGESDTLELKKGGCYGVRVFPEGSAVLEWMLSPRILRRLGG